MVRQPRVEILAANNSLTAATLNGRLYLCDAATPFYKVICAAIAPLGDYIAVISLDKEVFVLHSVDSRATFQEMSRHFLPKRATSVSFSHDVEWVIVSDAFGDVYKLPVDQSLDLRNGDTQSGDEACILGHFSTVTHMSLTSRLIVTGDRDARVRVSQWPGAYVVEMFALGHVDAVTAVAAVTSAGAVAVLSGSVDGTLRLWALNGQCASFIRVKDHAIVNTHRVSNYGPAPDAPSASASASASTSAAEVEAETGDAVIVTWVAKHPSNPDAALFGVYGGRAVFAVHGISSGTLGDIGVVGICNDVVCGMAVDTRYNKVWASVQGCPKLLWWRLESKGEGMEHGAIVIGAEVGREWENYPDVDGSRFEWLVRQRKRAMVEDWKGKKRRHVEIEGDD